MDEHGEKYQAYCSADIFLKGGGGWRGGLHAYNEIFISRHLYCHPERAGVDYIDHATN